MRYVWQLLAATLVLFGCVEIASATTGGIPGVTTTGIDDILDTAKSLYGTWGTAIITTLAILMGIGLIAKFFG